MRECFILLWVMLMSCTTALIAQPISRYNTFSYSVNDGLLQSTIAEMEIGQLNFFELLVVIF